MLRSSSPQVSSLQHRPDPSLDARPACGLRPVADVRLPVALDVMNLQLQPSLDTGQTGTLKGIGVFSDH
jgi:hypothetical protein